MCALSLEDNLRAEASAATVQFHPTDSTSRNQLRERKCDLRDDDNHLAALLSGGIFRQESLEGFFQNSEATRRDAPSKVTETKKFGIGVIGRASR